MTPLELLKEQVEEMREDLKQANLDIALYEEKLKEALEEKKEILEYLDTYELFIEKNEAVDANSTGDKGILSELTSKAL